MEKYDRNRIHSESMEFVGLIADKVNTIKHDYGLSEQTAIEICKLSATLYDSYKDAERLDRQSENAKRFKTDQKALGVLFGELVTRYKTERTKTYEN